MTNEPRVELSIVDQFDPETNAMLQAFYSRSHRPIQERVAEMGGDTVSVKESLKKFFVNYGHASIGQCGSTTMYIEGVSILAAKAYEDSQLFAGQETSTRFIDFANQPIHNPLNDDTDIQQKWIQFYIDAQLPVMEHVAQQYELDLSDKEQYNAAKARTFDILRAFVPAGCATQLSWYSNFTHTTDRLVQLCQHPLEEVRQVSAALAGSLQRKYPYAFANLDQKIEQFKDYYEYNNRGLNYLVASDVELDLWPEFQYSHFAPTTLRTLDGIERQKGVPAPRHLAYQGRVQFKYLLDYGSFRDIQRHRPCVQLMPILTTRYGFHDWYIDSLPESLQLRALLLIDSQTKEINALYEKHADTDIQYYIPLGFKVGCLLDCDYPEMVYISEIRTSKMVHPTLRKVAMKIAAVAHEYKFTNMFDCTEEEDFTVRRGSQTITNV